jgi:hypothetical protein
MSKRRMTADKRLGNFWNKIDQQGPADCWEWKGAKDTWGYGVFWTGFRHVQATRVLWFIVNDYLPDSDEFVCHHCDNPACCNPTHLYIASHRDNMRDMVRKGRSRIGTRAKLRKKGKKV